MYESPWLPRSSSTQGSAGDVKKSLYFAADLRASGTHNPNHLVSAADQHLLRGYLERVAPLLDEAMPLVPHRSEPMSMSILLAQKTSDPRRMADSVDALSSLARMAWPRRVLPRRDRQSGRDAVQIARGGWPDTRSE